MRATLKEVAKLANVGISTASYVINGTGLSKVSPKTQKTILRAAAKLGYRPNMTARSLRTSKSKSLGFILNTNADRYHNELTACLQEYMDQLGYTGIFAFSHYGTIHMKEICQNMLGRSVDGIITCSYRRDCFPKGFPLLFFANASAPSFQVDSVKIDFDHAIRISFEHLYACGHRRIAYIGNCKDERFLSYRKYLDEYSLAFKPEWIFDGWGTPATGENGMRKIILAKEPPSALIAFNDTVAISAINAAQRHGLVVPNDISVIGFDNISEAAYEHPRLTTCDTRIPETAHLLVDMMLARIKTPDMEFRFTLVKPELLIRESTAAPPRAKGASQ